MKKILIPFCAAAVVMGFSGCAGISALQVASSPGGAKLYADGKYIGETPASVPVKWGYYVVHASCESTKLRVEKPGYQPAETVITRRELGHRNRNGSYESGSKFGRGRTYPYVFTLKPAK